MQDLSHLISSHISILFVSTLLECTSYSLIHPGEEMSTFEIS